MPVYSIDDFAAHNMHQAEFRSYVAPARGSAKICGWRVVIEPGTVGLEHRVSHEEVFLALTGEPVLTLDGARAELAAGSVALAHAGSLVKLDNPSGEVAELWVTTTTGLTATTGDGAEIVPPWTT
jgi:quercetin dioxygenase-like cupin family protein